MYFGVERHKTLQGVNIPNTTYSVNNIYLDGVRFAAVIPSGDARYYLTDQVDSVKIVADDNGRAVSRMEYMPYGDIWFEEGDTNNAPKYNSQELDRESNLYYYNARHYSQEIARFVTADTIIDGEFDTQGWNRYAYCKNNPIIYRDPTGHAVDDGSANADISNDSRQKFELPQKMEIWDVKKLETYLKEKTGNHNIDLANGKGLKIVALRNYYDIDPSITKEQREKRGAYLTHGQKGEDKIKDVLFAIQDGKIVASGYGSTLSSRATGGYGKNANNDIEQGELYLGDAHYRSGLGNVINIYENKEKARKGDTTVPSTGGRGTQKDTQVHGGPTTPQSWNWSLGCVTFPAFQEYANKTYPVTIEKYLIGKDTVKENIEWSKMEGKLHILDVNKPQDYPRSKEKGL